MARPQPGRYSLESGLTQPRVGPVFTVPDGFLAQFDAESLTERADWLATLPALAQGYARRWSLTPDGQPRYGACGVVWPVRRADGTPAMLKISWPHDEALDEGVALRVWAGHGAVRLLEHDTEDYALLLERLDATRTLDTEPIDEAVETAAGLLRRLAVPAPPLYRSVAKDAERWVEELPAEAEQLGDPIPARALAAAVEYCRELGPRAGTVLVNEDLHYLNVLRGEREPWLVIDPKPVTGDLEWGVIPLLWNRYAGPRDVAARLDTIVRAAGLDRELAIGWTVARAVDNWLWSLAHGGVPDIETISEIATAFTG